MNIYINPLSVKGQCSTTKEAADLVRSLLESISYMSPAIQARRIQIYLDERVETNELIPGEQSTTTISRFSKNGKLRDLATRWYSVTRQSAKKLSYEDGAEVKVTTATTSVDKCEQGDVHSDLATSAENLLSFHFEPVFSEKDLILQHQKNSRKIKNINNTDRLVELLPRHEANPKHRKEAYIDKDRGVPVAPMPLNEEQAQHLLLTGIQDKNNDYIARHKSSNKIYRFKKTHTDREVYHGFQVDESDIDRKILDQI
ncbi:hypothetical protein [Agaribacterium sp. ZY112]|uniref:hypothetical protein n=1 Tax=Agaribacterium sp. ZY112 TaxID=3233574 RepID=UPI0035236996